MGLLLFADSTISFLATVGLLYIRRGIERFGGGTEQVFGRVLHEIG